MRQQVLLILLVLAGCKDGPKPRDAPAQSETRDQRQSDLAKAEAELAKAEALRVQAETERLRAEALRARAEAEYFAWRRGEEERQARNKRHRECKKEVMEHASALSQEEINEWFQICMGR